MNFARLYWQLQLLDLIFRISAIGLHLSCHIQIRDRTYPLTSNFQLLSKCRA
jgi:hypothetical protein